MSKTVIQYRYYDNNNTHNQPTTIDKLSLAMGTAFLSEEIKANYGLISSLGIQSLPGTKFYLNQNIDPVILGKTGIFELDLTGKSSIYKLTFDIESLDKIEQVENGYLIVDTIYDTEA